MVWYFLASTVRLLPGWLTFSTTMRAVPLALPDPLGNCRDVGRFFTVMVTSIGCFEWQARLPGVPHAEDARDEEDLHEPVTGVGPTMRRPPRTRRRRPK
jgi:hypothetical protein